MTLVEQPAVEEAAPGQRRLTIAFGVAAAVGIAALPVWSVGIGWPLTALAVAGVVLAARSARPAQPEREDGGVDRAWRIAAGASALALSAVPAVRASGPLAALCLAAAVLLGSYALVGGRSWAGVARGGLSFVSAAIAGIGWSVVEGHSRVPRAGRALLAMVVGAGLLLVFGSLLMTADPVFADLIETWTRAVSASTVARLVLGGVAAAWAAVTVAYLVNNRPGPLPPDPAPRRMLGPVEWAIPLILLDALFGLFVVVQVTVLFGGNEYVLGAGGPDYADFARGGFIQLGAVTVLTLGVVLVLATLARRGSPFELGLIRVLGGVLCGLTLVIVASALKRLALYADAYGFTWPRLLGFAGEVWLGLIFVLLLVAGIRLRSDWLPRAVVAAAVGVLFALVAVNPEALMARTLLDRLRGPYAVDVSYLDSLSADAVPVFEEQPEQWRYCLLRWMAPELSTPDAWYEFNLSREYARTRVPTKGHVCEGRG